MLKEFLICPNVSFFLGFQILIIFNQLNVTESINYDCYSFLYICSSHYYYIYHTPKHVWLKVFFFVNKGPFFSLESRLFKRLKTKGISKANLARHVYKLSLAFRIFEQMTMIDRFLSAILKLNFSVQKRSEYRDKFGLNDMILKQKKKDRIIIL